MVYFFSGTGNSEFVARRLAGLLGDGIVQIEPSSVVERDGRVGLVFPVYAWGLPQVVERFLACNRERLDGQYVYAVLTCGDDVGYADRVLAKAVDGRLDAVFSVAMPNTYVCLLGFDVDSREVARAKVADTLKRLPSLAADIEARKAAVEVCRGSMPWLKTYVMRPLFNRFLVTDKYFHTNARCMRCRRCERECPLGNIATDREGRVVWKHERCTGCLRCYHHCPAGAVQFGWFTKNKGQKTNDFN